MGGMISESLLLCTKWFIMPPTEVRASDYTDILVLLHYSLLWTLENLTYRAVMVGTTTTLFNHQSCSATRLSILLNHQMQFFCSNTVMLNHQMQLFCCNTVLLMFCSSHAIEKCQMTLMRMMNMKTDTSITGHM